MLFCVNLVIKIAIEFLNGGTSALIYYIGAGVYSYDTKMPMCSSLWFLTCLFVAYIFFWILFKQKKIYNQIFLCFIYLFILTVVTKLEIKHGITQLLRHIDVTLSYWFIRMGNKILR